MSASVVASGNRELSVSSGHASESNRAPAETATDLNGLSLNSNHEGFSVASEAHAMMVPSPLGDLDLASLQNPSDGAPTADIEGEDGDRDMFSAPFLPADGTKDSLAPDTDLVGVTTSGAFQFDGQEKARSEEGGSDLATTQGNTLEDNMSDDFGLSASAPGDRTDLGVKPKDNKSGAVPAWSELKTKAGKERKRLPLACIACRRKKIRCSGEKPACKHCLRSRIPCVYKVTTRKAAPRTDYMAMLDKRLKRMEDRIIKIVPKNEQDPAAANVVRAVVKPSLPGALSTGKAAGRKRNAEAAFGADLDNWARTTRNKQDDTEKHSSLLQAQEAEESKLLTEGADALPPKDIQEHLADTFFDYVYGQAYHILHKPSYMRKLKAGTLPPVLILSVCAVSARFSTHPRFGSTPNYLRGEEWAYHAREIVIKRYEWPNITIMTCALLLGLHEFGTCHGGRSWAFGGIAIRMSAALQLHVDLEHDSRGSSGSSPPSKLSFIDREIRRRAMWACFVMDRFNSSGVDRPMFVREDKLKIQLPIKEKLFQLDMPGSTEDLEGRVPHPPAPDEADSFKAQDNMGVAAYMVRAIALWGRIINYLNQGGKDDDPHPMWDDKSEYARLLTQAESFHDDLPDGLKYTAENLHLHHTEKMANQFLFLHVTTQQNVLFMNRFARSSSPSSASPSPPSSTPSAASASRDTSQQHTPEDFATRAGAKAFAAANRISELLRDAEQHLISAPFVGYCAFLSATVHIFGVFSGSAAVEGVAKRNLATNIRFLAKMKRYWGMFHFMAENLREQYRTCADAARLGHSADGSTNGSNHGADGTRSTNGGTINHPPPADATSPVFQYGDWFDQYPHGVSPTADSHDPVTGKRHEPAVGDDAVLEQKPELHTVDEFLTQLSPQSNEGGRDSSGGAARPTKRKSIAKKGGNGGGTVNNQSTAGGNNKTHHLEPLLTEFNEPGMVGQIQQRQQQQQQHQHQQRRNSMARMGVRPGPFHQLHGRTATHPGIEGATYTALSPISPVAMNGNHHPQSHPHHQAFSPGPQHHHQPHHQQSHHRRHPSASIFTNDGAEILSSLGGGGSAAMSMPAGGAMPQLDRQLVFNAYGGLDPTTLGTSDWDALAGTATSGHGQNGDRSGGGTGNDDDNGSLDSILGAFSAEPSSAWFMPFNMEPPEIGGHDYGLGGAGMASSGSGVGMGMGVGAGNTVGGGMGPLSGLFSPSLQTPGGGGGLGLRRGGH